MKRFSTVNNALCIRQSTLRGRSVLVQRSEFKNKNPIPIIGMVTRHPTHSYSESSGVGVDVMSQSDKEKYVSYDKGPARQVQIEVTAV